MTAPQRTFRQWLVKKLTESRWGAPDTTPPSELADRLGVSLSVLEEAKAERVRQMVSRGKVRRGGRMLIAHDYASARVIMPRAIHALWIECCRSLGVERATVFRSLIHQFLLVGERPKYISSSWFYQGKIYKNRRVGRTEANTRITKGAQVVLDHYARSWDVPSSAVLRGLITDLLDGRVQKLKIVAFSEIWGDPDRYLHPEKFTTCT